MNKEPVCRRCGRCCFFQRGSELVKCKHLVVYGNDKTFCRIYNNKNRVGLSIMRGVKCGNRVDSVSSYEGCPYNKDGGKKDEMV